MTSGERINALLEGRAVDHVGLYLFARGFCARSAGISLKDFYTNPRESLCAQLRVSRMHGQDENAKFGFASAAGWDFGGEVRMPADEFDQAPTVVRYPVEAEEEIFDLPIPNVETSGMMPLNLEFCRLQEKAQIKVTMSIGAPLMYASNVCGLDKLSRWMIKSPEVAHRLLRLVTDYGVETAKYWVKEFGPENIEFRTSTPTSSNQVISPKQFREFSLPYLKELHEKVLNLGVTYIYTHICGDQRRNLPHYAEVPFGDPGIVSFGHEVDLAGAIEILGHKCIIVGNVDPRIVLTGTPEEVYEHSRKCIDIGREAPRGFILGTGCELPPMSPSKNVRAMRKAVNDFGWYR